MLFSLEERVQRDEKNAKHAKEIADKKFKEITIFRDDEYDITGWKRKNPNLIEERNSYSEISNNPFNAMAEIEIISKTDETNDTIYYGHERTTANIVIDGFVIVPWTNPFFQIALTTESLDEEFDPKTKNFNVKSIIPHARARYSSVLNGIEGLYEPGGNVNYNKRLVRKEGLKSVKFDMTPEQVRSFTARMKGIIFIGGAPGTGKTTISLQRIRFLFDQQRLYENEFPNNYYSDDKTIVFLTNDNLLQYTKNLLNNELQINVNVVKLVQDYIENYVEKAWEHKLDARQLHISDTKLRKQAIESFFSLCTSDDLGKCWTIFEKQIISRLRLVNDSEWYKSIINLNNEKKLKLLTNLNNAITNFINKVKLNKNPYSSQLRTDGLYKAIKSEYEEIRNIIKIDQKDKFDLIFRKWLFYVYDPIDCLLSFFSDNRHAGEIRIKEGTAGKVDHKEITELILAQMKKRNYYNEQIPWIAFLLRFFLPEKEDPDDRFKGLLPAYKSKDDRSTERLSHVVIDEAQDLSAPEAAFLASLVDSSGALTVSADYDQTVSPVHGVTDHESLKYGTSIRDFSTILTFPFKVNLRQTKEIGAFLKALYYKMFNKKAEFEANEIFSDHKPILQISPKDEFPKIISQYYNLLSKNENIKTIALLQINRDLDEQELIFNELIRLKIPCTKKIDFAIDNKDLLVTDVETIKGLEFDCCIVIGLDNYELMNLKFAKNRSYVALSRACRRLSILCEEFPSLLKNIDTSLYDRY